MIKRLVPRTSLKNALEAVLLPSYLLTYSQRRWFVQIRQPPTPNRAGLKHVNANNFTLRDKNIKSASIRLHLSFSKIDVAASLPDLDQVISLEESEDLQQLLAEAREFMVSLQKEQDNFYKLQSTLYNTEDELANHLCELGLQQHFETYCDILSKISQQLSTLSTTSLGSFGALLVALNNIHESDWRDYINRVISVGRQFTTTSQLLRAFYSINKHLKNYRVVRSSVSLSNMSKSSAPFNEKELLAILKTSTLSKFATDLPKIVKQHTTQDQADFEAVFKLIIVAGEILSKFLRVISINSLERKLSFNELLPIVSSNTHRVTPDIARQALTTVITKSDEWNSDTFAHFYELQKTNSNTIKLVNETLAVWKHIGSHDLKFYQESLKPAITKLLQEDQLASHRLPALAFSLLTCQIVDEELWKLLLHRIEGIELNSILAFEKKSLHTTYQYLKLGNRVNVDLSAHQNAMNSLSKFCIGIRSEKNLFSMKLPSTFNQDVDCCDEETVKKVLEYTAAKSTKHRPVSSSRIGKPLEQNIDMSPQEQRVFDAIMAHFPEWLQGDVEIINQYPVCLYRVDIAIKIPTKRLKIALELSGHAYRVNKEQLIGKKSLRAELLKYQGWVFVAIDISESSIFSLLSSYNQEAAEKLAFLIYNMIRASVNDQKKIQLPVAERKVKSLWVTAKK